MTEETVQQTQDKISQLLNVDSVEDENVKSIVKELTTSDNIETKTDITSNQMIVMTRAIWYAKRYNVKTLDVYTRKILLKLLVSKNRGGRKDLTDTLSNLFGIAISKQKNEQVKI